MIILRKAELEKDDEMFVFEDLQLCRDLFHFPLQHIFCFCSLSVTFVSIYFAYYICFSPSSSHPTQAMATHTQCFLHSYYFLMCCSMVFYFRHVLIIPFSHQWYLHLLPLQLHFQTFQLTTQTIEWSYCILFWQINEQKFQHLGQCL